MSMIITLLVGAIVIGTILWLFRTVIPDEIVAPKWKQVITILVMVILIIWVLTNLGGLGLHFPMVVR